MTDRIRLSDDGTMDTVLVCRECGEEARYNYDDSFADTPSEDESEDSAFADYDTFVVWAIEDFDSEHVCGED